MKVTIISHKISIYDHFRSTTYELGPNVTFQGKCKVKY